MSHDQYRTPYENGYNTGLGMAQGDSGTLGDLERMLTNPNMDPEFRRGLISGKQEAARQLYARENEEHSHGM